MRKKITQENPLRFLLRFLLRLFYKFSHFTLKDGLDHLYAVKQVKEEVETYKKNMERNHTKYKIVEQTEQPDGSIIVKIIKQYNAAPVGDYLN